MGAVDIAFDGEHLLNGRGDIQAVENIDAALKRIAAAEQHRQRQVMALIWLVLNTPTSDPQRPDLFRDYLPAWDFDFDITAGKGAFTVLMRGMRSTEGEFQGGGADNRS